MPEFVKYTNMLEKCMMFCNLHVLTYYSSYSEELRNFYKNYKDGRLNIIDVWGRFRSINKNIIVL